ncbi:unnamed protein product [Symbiodinium necroappetens]|uniref:Uncharacterized protein n=1 Tax=Symbiodinium necroappetens TaxID=1628268 RepID=A0A812ZB25_9DINO|nr:unnamed protein product [Symbiodinium sp. CCMP2456]CAE7818015.1 unnamed protein product [Symbiodinium necroappetens]
MLSRLLSLSKAKKVKVCASGDQFAKGSSSGSLDGGSAESCQLVAADSDGNPGLADVRSWFREGEDDFNCLRTVQLHCPGQVLPKANAATLYNRLHRFALCGVEGSAAFAGGDELGAILATIPLQVIFACTDSLPANVAVNALEQQKALTQMSDASAYRGYVYTFCTHHQGNLSSKPIVLSVPNVATGIVDGVGDGVRVACMLSHSLEFRLSRLAPHVALTGMVRMAHSMKSALHSRRMAAIAGNLASTVEVYPVATLPQRVTACIARNARKLASCRSYMTEDDVALVLSTLNEDWSLPLSKMKGRLTHWCEAGCCTSLKETRFKVKRCLELLILQGFEVPLLYRWKHVQPAAEFCLRAMLVHGLLEHTWRLSLGEQSDPYSEPRQELLNYDEDNADLSPAEKQKVRATKVLQLLSGPDGVET